MKISKFNLHCIAIVSTIWIATFTLISPVYADDTPPAPPDSPEESQTETPPESTDMVMLNDAETTLPLATHNTQEIISTADPIWCPAGVKPMASSNGCTSSYPNLSSLVTGYIPNKSGTIWIENTTDTGTEVLMDGDANWAAAKNFNLTLQGGWTLAPSLTAISGNSTFNNAINIVNWNGNITVNNILFENVSGNTAHPETAALYIETSKNIKINSLTANNTSGLNMSGAYLDNTSGTNSNSVTVSNSAFDNNNHTGLWIHSNGAVTISNIVAKNAVLYHGLYIKNNFDAAPSSVVIKNGNFYQNEFDGLGIFSNGPVTLDTVISTDNSYGGAYIYTRDSNNNNVFLLHTNIFNNNSQFGIVTHSDGITSINHIIASDNGSVGAGLDGWVNIYGSGVFNNNGGVGLSIGNGKLNNITAIGNVEDGARVGVGEGGTFTLTGSNIFSNNGQHGIVFNTSMCIFVNCLPSYISISNIQANNNEYDGIKFEGSGTAAYIKITVAVTANGNDRAGVNAENGVTTLSINNITASYNDREGLLFDGSKITLTGMNIFNNNGDEGLWVSANSILLKNINANSNGASSDTSGVSLHVPVSTGSSSILISGVNSFNFNALHGIEIHSNSAITLSNVTAIHNGHNVADGSGSGLFIESISASTAQPIVINGLNNFNYNEQNGLHVDSASHITVSNIIASNNGFNGADLDNSSSTAQYKITILGHGIFESNNASGLSVESNGAVTIYNLNANHNQGNGAYINTQGITAPQLVTLYGVNNFVNNGNGISGSGLVVFADGNITINKITSSSNTGSGAILDNFTNWNSQLTPFVTFGSVAINGYGNFSENLQGDGLNINTNGSALVTRISSVLNGNDITDHGILIAAGKGITMTCSSAYDNSGYGLFITLPNTAILRLKGFFAYGNAGPNETLSGILIRTNCL